MDVSLKDKIALVTGASSGMGASFARQLAAMGMHLCLTARRADRLHALAEEIAKTYAVNTRVFPLDIAQPGAAEELFNRTEGSGKPIHVLINNAGFANLGIFLDIPYERSAEQLAVNVTALTETTWRFGRAMRERGGGYILNMSSFSAFTPVPNMATYSAGKVYVRNFSEAVAVELEGTGVRVCALCPGPVDTEFIDVACRTAKAKVLPGGADKPEIITAAGLDALFGGRNLSLPVMKDKVNAFFIRLLPRGFIMRTAGREMGLHKPADVK